MVKYTETSVRKAATEEPRGAALGSTVNANKPAKDNTSIPASQQVWRLLSLLKRYGKINTLEGRRLGINHVAGRIRNIKDLGYEVETHWTQDIDQNGKLTTIALYVLKQNRQMTLPGFQGKEVTHDC